MTMLSVMLFWLFGLSSIDSFPADKRIPADTITISGVCWDVTTGMDLKASVTALVNGKRRKVGESNAAGHFTFQISDSTQALSFEVDGYPTKTIPVIMVGKMNANAQFMISVPVINRDSQQVARTYQPIDKPADKPRSLGKIRNVYFRVLHARTFRRIPATICFMDSRRGRTECVELDSAKVPSFVRLNPGEKMTFDVRADGYQPYRGELVVGPSGAADDLYQIKLLPLYNVLAVSYDMPANQKFRYEFRYATNKHFMSRLNVPIRFFDWGTFKPGQDYKLLATTLDGHVVADETFRMGPGLNLAMFRLNRPGQSPLIGTEAQPSTFFDSTILYFNQSDYSLRSEVKGKLDTVAWRMINRRTMLGRITGYTDNVGERGLNMTLSEYRTRVVAQYLRQKGVGANQLSSSWKGPDAPAAPNDTEENKAKNRRVVIRFFTR